MCPRTGQGQGTEHRAPARGRAPVAAARGDFQPGCEPGPASLLLTPPELLERTARGWQHPQTPSEGSQTPEREVGKGNSFPTADAPAAHCCMPPAPSHSHAGTSPAQGMEMTRRASSGKGLQEKGLGSLQVEAACTPEMKFDWPFISVYIANCCRCISYREIHPVVKSGAAKN